MAKELSLGNKILKLPAFFPDATRAFLRAASPEDALLCGVQGMEMSTWHLLSRPGPSLIKAAGGLHAFSGWPGPILTDSGGFQAYSLVSKNPSKGRIGRDGIAYMDERRGRKVELTPERCISAQLDMGSDILMCLDCCTDPAAPAAEQERAVELTIQWAARCREEFDGRTAGRTQKPLLFAVIQGGADLTLRRQCAGALTAMGFEGYGYGGWPVDKQGSLLYELLEATAGMMPGDAVKYAMGLGRPEEIVRLCRAGYELFDCVIPTREARHAKLYAFNGKPLGESGGFYDAVYINEERMARDFRPVEEGCPCEACQRHTRAFLHHLFACGDALGLRLATAHNLSFYARLMGKIRHGDF